jgi:phenylacetate-coenzyme A ligase PaaK-like adenylate-forming protein
MPIDFRARDFLVPFAMLELGRTLERLQWAAPDELRDYQVKRLRAVLRHAAGHVPHWQALFARTGFDPRALEHPRDLERLPLLTKEDVRDDVDSLVSRRFRRSRRWHATSGTLGRPLRVLLDRRANALEFCYYRRCWGWAGYRLGEHFAELGGYHFLRDGRDPERLLQWQPLLRRLMINTNRLSPARVGEVRAALARYRPRFLKGLPSALEHLARCVDEDHGGRFAFHALFSGGEVVMPETRARVESAFGCRLFDSYGHMERTVAISQCEEGRYHVHDDYGLLEVRDVKATADGRRMGRATGTGLHNLAMPLVRYDVGDAIELARDGERCACGRGLGLVAAIHGRSVDVLTTPDGRVLSALSTAFDGVPSLDSLQLVQVAPDALELRAVPGPGWSEASRQELLATGARALGQGMRFEVRLVQREDLVRTPTGKARPVVGLGS